MSLHPTIAQALAPFAQPSSVVHEILEAQRVADDLAANEAKQSWNERNQMAALACQINEDDKIDRYYRGNEK